MRPHWLRGGALGGQAHGAQLASQGRHPRDGAEVGGRAQGPQPRPLLPRPSSPPSERKGLGFSHGLTAVTGSVSLNYRDTMCINRVIASEPLRQTAKGAEWVRTNPTVSLVCGFPSLL